MELKKHDFAVKVVRRMDIFGASDLSDNELAMAAEDLFLAIDREETEYLQAASKNEAFDFLNDPNEDIYSLQDGKPLLQ